ncbi:hypothetical protein GJW-30_1_00540 [Variibacter gotjawalensis]|uniref:Uncharacterized protein n=1 Tax=Variibacter gotjawalensis TaxID=1333996 RepID=A0A0S3PQ14_9BRAD|nr:hypothetical protein [Variibacter gotjawalensis]NIK48326.1 hypothetical protein [Variibacter gotjawalensis]RZS50196.1 hypothetical protein EV661_2650 [Variibacter gotjawalensis]BAT58027.1 hypothetical protein GJW-30_1_00540 [Variibacter gotjawalensis]
MEAANDPAAEKPSAEASAPKAAETGAAPEAAKAEASEAETKKPEPAKAGPVILFTPRPDDKPHVDAEPQSAPRAASPSRRFSLLAASIALAACLGGMVGAAAVAALMAPPKIETVDAGAAIQDFRNQLSLMRASIKTLSEAPAQPQRPQTDKALNAQVGKLAEAIERIEKSSAEPNARLAKLGESVDRLEKKFAAAQAPVQQAAAQPAAPLTTGSVKPQPPQPPQVAQAQPVIGDWHLREVYDGVALIEGRYGPPMEVQPGDDVRGLGRVQTIKRQPDGRWAVVTSRGLVVSSR